MTIYARLSYNSNNWQHPSGSMGKSKNRTTFEAIHGFGFEEWLFDPNSLTDGYYYGYIQGIKQNYQAGDEQHTLKLYTLHYPVPYANAQRLFVAEIKEWEYVDWHDNQLIVKDWRKSGRIKQMRKQLVNVGAELAPFDVAANDNNIEKIQLVNIRFKILPKVILKAIPLNHSLTTYNRFKLKR
jgi:hypothetical protein